jgi:hypothetical protein
MCELVYQATTAAATPSIDTVTLLTLVLAALGVLLTALAIMIGVAAIWGYVGMRDSVKEMAEKRVDLAMKDVLEKYPPAADMLRMMDRIQAQLELWDRVRNQTVTDPAPNAVEMSSNNVVEVKHAETPLESINQQVTPIAKYPGEEKADASADGKSD